MNPKIVYIRNGFANNSSSTHSIVYKSPTINKYQDLGSDDDYFGWDDFLLVSKEAKRRYVQAQFEHNGIVDHQSQYYFPKHFKNHKISKEMKSAFKELLLDDNVVVRGGNDNDDRDYNDPDEMPVKIALPRDWYGELVYRDENYGWLLFDRINGLKLRIAKDLSLANEDCLPKHPELIDLNITNYCSGGCSFCYRNCGFRGEHAPMKNIESAIQYMKNVGVFECVLGGGDVLAHPNFKEILKMFKDANICTSMTTARDPRDVEDFIPHLKSIAFSAKTHPDMKCHRQYLMGMSAFACFYFGREHRIQVSLQFIEGVHSEKLVNDLIELCLNYYPNLRFSFVGYKETGRAGKQVIPDYTNEFLKNILSKVWRLHVDTSFLKKHPFLSENNYTDLKEGTHSCFIDAVTNKVHKSSFETGVGYEFYENDMEEIFKKIQTNSLKGK